jgi:putative transposase
LKKNSYAESLEGEFRDFCPVVEENGDISVRVKKELERKSYVAKTEARWQ